MLNSKSKTPSSAYAIIPPRKAPCEPVFAQREQRISMTINRPWTTTITSVPLCPIPRAMASTTCVMPRPKMKRIFASKICRTEFTPERRAMVRNHPAPRRMRRIMGMRGSIEADGKDTATGVPPGLNDMFTPRIADETVSEGILYCYAKPFAQSMKIIRRVADFAIPSALPGCDSVRPVASSCPEGSCGVKLPAKLSFCSESRQVMPGRSRRDSLFLRAAFAWRMMLFLFCALFCASPFDAFAQEQHEDEIVANLAGGRAIVHVAKDLIVFAALDQPVERNSIPPRVMDLDGTHIGVLFGASELRVPADPKPIRLDRNFQRVGRADPRYQSAPGEGATHHEPLAIAVLEKLRPLVAQLHHKLDFSSEDPILQVVIIGYAPSDYGPEVWTVEYRIEQEQVATRGEDWQTRV